MDVAGPVFRLAISPAEPRVGEEVRAAVKDFPVREDVDFRWAALPRNATLVNVGEKEISFYLRDDGPAEISVSARMPLAGKDLGRVSPWSRQALCGGGVEQGAGGTKAGDLEGRRGARGGRGRPGGGTVLMRVDVSPPRESAP
jgi:hypothetical protein